MKDKTAAQGAVVLVVEDEMFVALELEQLLQSAGLQVLGPYPTAAAALKTLSESACDLALLDFSLREGTSEPVSEALRERAIPFAMLTAYSRQQLPESLRDVPHLQKPIWPDALLRLIKALLPAAALHGHPARS